MQDQLLVIGVIGLIVVVLALWPGARPSRTTPRDLQQNPGANFGTTTAVRGKDPVGVGCLLQALGLLMPVLGYVVGAFISERVMPAAGLAGGTIGAILGIAPLLILLIGGSRKVSFWSCDNCGNRIADEFVKLCPTCRLQIERPPSVFDRARDQ